MTLRTSTNLNAMSESATPTGETTDTDNKQCTDKACQNPAKYALWMGDQFSRVREPHEAFNYEDGDLHPYVCETCLPRYERYHGDHGEFVRPVEKLVADGGLSPSDTSQDALDEKLAAIESTDKYLRCDCGDMDTRWITTTDDGFRWLVPAQGRRDNVTDRRKTRGLLKTYEEVAVVDDVPDSVEALDQGLSAFGN